MAPAVSPDGEWIAFTANNQLRKIPRGGGSAITLADSLATATKGVAWLDDGTIVYRDDGNRLRQVPDVGGEAAIIWMPPPEGDMRPMLPTPLPDGRGVLFNACYTGSCQPLESWVLDLRSPDGTRLAIGLVRDDGEDIWIKELDDGPLSRLTVHEAGDHRARWTADGQMVSFVSTRSENNDVYIRRADATQPAELLLDLDEPIWEAAWSRDGEWLAVRTGGTGQNRDIWAMRLRVDSAPAPLLGSDFDERAITLSPDGRWITYQSDETGQNEIYIRPFPDIAAGKWTISVGGGSMPLWAHNGREIFYVDGEDRMAAASVRTGTRVEVVSRRALFSLAPYALTSNYTPYDVTADDQRFLMIRPVGTGDGEQRPLILVENWFEELKQKVGG